MRSHSLQLDCYVFAIKIPSPTYDFEKSINEKSLQKEKIEKIAFSISWVYEKPNR